MSQTGKELREMMRRNLFNELSSFFTNDEEGRRISAQIEDKFFQNSRNQEEYLTAFMKHLEQLKTLKVEAYAQSMTIPSQTQTSTAETTPALTPSLESLRKSASVTASLPATIVPTAAGTAASAEMQSRNLEIVEYLSQCQKKISPAFLESIVDPRQKAFFELLINEIRSVRATLAQGVPPTHPELGPRIKVIVEKVRAIIKSQQVHSQRPQALPQQTQQPSTQPQPPSLRQNLPSLTRHIPLAQAVSEPITAAMIGAKRKRKPAEPRRPATKQTKSAAAPVMNSSKATGTSAAPISSRQAPAMVKTDSMADPNAVVPGIQGFFDQVVTFDKKPKANQLRQSALRIESMLEYIRTREGFEAAQIARNASIATSKQQAASEIQSRVTSPVPSATGSCERQTDTDDIGTSADYIVGQTLLAGESAPLPDEILVTADDIPYNRELDQIQLSGLFNILDVPCKNASWRMLKFDLIAAGVPSLLVGIRNDYNEKDCTAICSSGPSVCLDRIDYRAQKGNSSLSDANIIQIDALLRRCMAQRRPCLYDLVCTWHSAIKHVFSIDTNS